MYVMPPEIATADKGYICLATCPCFLVLLGHVQLCSGLKAASDTREGVVHIMHAR